MEPLVIRPKWWVVAALRDFRSKVFAATGGLGAGKTDGMVTWHHDRVTRNPRSQFSWFFEPTHRKIEDAAIPTFKKVLERMGYVQGRHYRITKSPNYVLKYTLSDQEIHFHSYDRPDLIVATEISHATLDEAGDADVEAYRNIRARIRDTRAVIRQFFVGGAPQGINWFADTFDSDTLEGWDTTIPRDHRNAQKGYRRFTLWTDDNWNNLPEDYLDNLEDTYGHNANLIRSYRFGQFCPLVEGAAYSNYNPVRHDIDDIEPDPYREIALTWDFNANPLAWIALQRTPFHEYGDRIIREVAIHEANTGATQLDEAVVEFAAKFPRSRFADTPIALYGDMSGHGKSHKVAGSDYDNIRRILGELGYRDVSIRAAKANPPETDSVEAVQRAFLKNLIYITKRCRMTRKSLLATTWKEGVRKIDKPQGETWTHWTDALKYYAYKELRKFTGTTTREIHGVNA